MDQDPTTGVFPVADCVVGKLRHALLAQNSEGSPPPRVVNLAADGFTSQNVLHGASPMLSQHAWAEAGEAFPIHPEYGGVLAPLDALEALHSRDPVTHVLLSVGGNDVREILTCMHHLPRIMKDLLENYEAICTRILNMPARPNLILMFQYLPCVHQTNYGVYQAIGSLPGPGTAMQKICSLMERIYNPVLNLARQHGLAVVDLPRTLDPYDGELYRLQIEPSAAGSSVIATVAAAAVAATPCAATEDNPSKSWLFSARHSDGYTAIVREENVFDADADRPYRIIRAGEEVSRDDTMLGEGPGRAGMGSPGGEDGASESDGAAPRTHLVSQLVAMGFSDANVRQALTTTGNLPQQALEILLRDQQDNAND